MEVVNYIINECTKLIANGGFIVGFLLIVLEAFIPMLPLGVIVTLNINAFGYLFGITISWLATCLGGMLVYLIFLSISNNFIFKHVSNKTAKKLKKGMNKFKKIPFSHLVLIITLPFTPSFLINILSGISLMNKEKFMIALLIGKLFMVSFWGYIGMSFIDSLQDIKAIVFIILALGISYVISKIISKKMDLE